eukprot:CAMPEP_0198717816 /NCGR_PEP_ID=MMETSP1471-20131121/46687_1 /TAXON_ID=41880 /ORGANISM="Pycnococcus provasolii, Strain RCC733" /LENGTH=127 /DNA_ID=CAMNT_0044478437 /DNA_START=138 /DNA_END=521 /DNA_ORIENTATION=+
MAPSCSSSSSSMFDSTLQLLSRCSSSPTRSSIFLFFDSLCDVDGSCCELQNSPDAFLTALLTSSSPPMSLSALSTTCIAASGLFRCSSLLASSSRGGTTTCGAARGGGSAVVAFAVPCLVMDALIVS